MKITHAIAALAATTLMTTAAVANGPKHKKDRGSASSTNVNAGVAAAGRDGAVAGGIAGSQSTETGSRADRRSSRDANSATTSTTGAVYTDNNRGSAAINSAGSAVGTGTVRSSSEGEVYSSTTRNGSDADAYGNSDASATARPK